MRSRGWCLAIAVAALGVSATAQQPVQQPAQPPVAAGATPAAPPIRIYIRSGLKTHAPGQHDYPQYLADWNTVLDDSNIDVDVDRGTVTLTGTVKSAEAKTKAVSIAKATDGVKSVRDNLKVGTTR